MNFLVMFDSFKGCATSSELNAAFIEGMQHADYSFESLAFSDGGEGFLASYRGLPSYEKVMVNAHNANGHPMLGRYLSDGYTAIIEIARVVGLPDVDTKYPCMARNTEGVGELILEAVENGHKQIIIGLGGSSTNDCGVGLLSALGVKFYDIAEGLVPPLPSGIHRIVSMDTSSLERFKDIKFIVAADVDNPLLGLLGASFVFAAQKGFTAAEIAKLDKSFSKFADVTEQHIGRNVANDPGTGAAGGLGFALKAFLNADIMSGAELLIHQLGIYDRLHEFDLIFTGEGKSDQQSLGGKGPMKVAGIAHDFGVPTVVISGDVQELDTDLSAQGVIATFSLQRGISSLEDAMDKEHALSQMRMMGQNMKNILALKKPLIRR